MTKTLTIAAWRTPLLILGLSLGLNACDLYRVDVQQGNVLSDAKLRQLKPGMDKAQVQAVLGTPLIKDPFHPDRWDYAYSFKPSYGTRKERHVTVHFNAAGQLTRIGGDVAPATAPTASPPAS